jgi:CRISPR type IV-associated DEAD/DEAH-box helicase Csf4
MKKVFSIHLDPRWQQCMNEVFGLKLDVQQSRFCTQVFKDVVECESPQECAKRIVSMDLDWREAYTGERIVASSSKCEREALELAAVELSVSSNQIYSVIVNAALERKFESVLKEREAKAQSQAELATADLARPLSAIQEEFMSWAYAGDWGKASGDQSTISFAELGTGSGKTLLALLLARNLAKQRKRTWIAVPSLAVQKQFLLEQRKWFGDTSGIAMVSGRSEFVSEHRLVSLIEESSAKTSDSEGLAWKEYALQWIDRLADNPFQGDRRCWLMDSFYEYVPNFPFDASDICLTVDVPPDDSGSISYFDQFDSANRADTVVLTHAYLALETMSRIFAGARALKADEATQRVISTLFSGVEFAGMPRADYLSLIDQKQKMIAHLYNPLEVGRLTLPHRLVVDEAHMLEENFSQATSTVISVRRLPLTLASLIRSKEVVSDKSLKTLLGQLDRSARIVCGDSIVGTQDSIWVNRADPANQRLADAVENLSTVLNEIRVVGTSQEAAILRRSQFALRSAFKNHKSSVCLLSTSPIRRYPRLIIGKVNQQADLRILFNHMGIEATMLLSATIYMPSISGSWDPSGFLSSVGLVGHDASGYRAQQADWLYDPVTLFMPPTTKKLSTLGLPEKRTLLRPSSEEAESRAWISQLAPVTRWVCDTAQGGVLILMTSFGSAEGLADALLKLSPDLAERLIVSRPRADSTASQLKTLFIEKTKLGIKPVWVAVGSSWTGLNLSGAEYGTFDKNLLTDLVIPRTPYGMNRSLSGELKQRGAASLINALQSAALYLKQGVGRLIREAGVEANRRIFFLDSRVNDTDKKALSNMVTALFSPYKHRGEIPNAVLQNIVPLALESTPARAGRKRKAIQSDAVEAAKAGGEISAQIKPQVALAQFGKKAWSLDDL